MGEDGAASDGDVTTAVGHEDTGHRVSDAGHGGDTEPTGLERWAIRRLRRGRLGRFATVAVVVIVAGGVLVVGGSIAGLDCGDTPAIVRLELAGTSDGATAALIGDGSAPCTRSDVRDALLGDLAFIAGYVALLVVASVAFGVTGYRVGRFRRLALPMAAGAVAAGVLDLAENLSLWLGVDREPADLGVRSDLPFQLAATFAWAKWLLVVVIAAYVVGGLVGYLLMPRWILELRAGLVSGGRDAARDLPTIGDAAPPATPATDRSAPAAPGGGPADPPPSSGDATDEAADDEPRPGAAGPAPIRYGIALSGGGVRSATFALGGMQALDASGDRRWDDATRITSVSGGGYMSGAWALTRGYEGYEPPPGRIDPWSDPGAEDRRRGIVSAEETHLRQNLGYLLKAEHHRPGAIPTLLIGLLANVGALLLLVYLVARPFGWLIVELVDADVADAYEGGDYELSVSTSQWVPAVVWLVVGVVSLLVWVLYSRYQRWRDGGIVTPLSRTLHLLLQWLTRVGLTVAIALGLVLVVAPTLMIVVPGELLAALGGTPGPVVAAISSIAGVGVVASVRKLLTDQASRWATKLGGVLLLVAVGLIAGWWATDAAVDGVADTVVPWSIALIVAAVGLYAVSPEWWAMAPFYRGRLRTAYAIRNRDGVTTSYAPGDEPLLEDLRDGPGPLAEYCCALNIKDSRVETLSGIPALSFTMSADAIAVHHVDPITGARSTWRCTPAEMRSLMTIEAPRLTPMLAVATSGAAVAPAMGRLGKGTTNALLAFANIRLGVWLPHPRWASRNTAGRAPYPRVRMSYLFKEVFGLFDSDDLHVYVTDGAHWEGTGIVELFRDDDVDEAIAFDAGGAGADSLVSPAEVVTLSSLELFDDVDIDVEPLRAASDGTRGGGLAQRVATVGLVRGIGGDGEPSLGVLWYCRNVLAEDSSPRLKSYAERFDTFPSVSTINQFFDDEKFQSYRVLGYEAGSSVLAARSILAEVMKGCTNLDELRAYAGAADRHWSIAVMSGLLRSDAEFRKVRDTLDAAPRMRLPG